MTPWIKTIKLNNLLILHMTMCNIMCDYKEVMVMATNLQIDDKLIQKAVRLGGHKTKKAAVSKALIEYIQNIEQEKILSMFGTVEYDPEYDYKEQRRKP